MDPYEVPVLSPTASDLFGSEEFVEVEVSGDPSPSEVRRERGSSRFHRGWVGKAVQKPQENKKNEAKTSSNITRTDVANIFRRSKSTSAVTREQIERIEEVHSRISDGVDFDFNYICLLTIASIIAGIGLIADSSTIVVSSMLLSPLMGPVVGMAYGVIVWDMPLVRRSLRNECVSIVICIFFGICVCVTTGWTELSLEWPTNEMTSRGNVTNLLIGIPVAFFSGLGVAVSVLDEQTSSLVGVAVSASLLPPAVNAGFCWIYSIALQTDVVTEKDKDALREHEFAKMGGISLALTIANIALVAIAGMLMFRVKEVLPVKKCVFWNDLKTARQINQKRALLMANFDEDEGDDN